MTGVPPNNAASDADYVLEIYRAYREKIVHEDGLVHQRMIWFVTLQALLFTSFAILLGEAVPDPTQGWELDLDRMRKLALVFSSVGVVSAGAAICSVLAAFSAIDDACRQWAYTKTELWKDARQGIANDLPPVAGATASGAAKALGKFAAVAFPCLVALAWVFIACLVYGVDVFRF